MLAAIVLKYLLPQLVLLIFAGFFYMGMILIYSYFWTQVRSAKGSSKGAKLGVRVMLPIGTLAICLLLIVTAQVAPANEWLYTTLGLFAVAFPILDDHLQLPEYLERAAALVLVWLITHWQHGLNLQSLLGLAVVLVLLAIVWEAKEPVRYHAAQTVLVSGALAIVFWLSLPNVSLSDPLLYLHIALYFAMAGGATYYWQGQKRQNLAIVNNAVQGQTAAGLLASYSDDADKYFQEAKESGQPLSLAIIEIDNFDDLTQRYGQLAANKVLIDEVALLQQILRQYPKDTHLLRVGGQEFNLMLMNSTAQEAAPVVLDCWESTRAHLFTWHKQDIALTLSCGVVETTANDPNIDAAYTRGVNSLRQSKQAGRDAITVEGVAQNAKKAAKMLPTYSYFAQPIVDASQTGQPIVKNELLLREFDRSRWLLPKSFEIPITTQISLAKRVLKSTVCRSITLNLTAKQFSDPEVARAFIYFKKHEPRLDEFVIEIMDVPNLMHVKEISELYRAGGIKVYLDDVGSDNSYELVEHMFSYLDGVKFAMQNLRKTNTNEQMTERINFWQDIAKKYHLTFVLEGVETAKESAAAIDRGLTLQQGYYFGKPALPMTTEH